MPEKRAILYAASAGDVLGTYLRWREGKRDERQTAATYSAQFFDLCKALGRPGVATFPDDEQRTLEDGDFSLFGLPQRGAHVGGIGYHLFQLRRALKLIARTLRSGATDVIVLDGVTHWFLLAPLRLFGRRLYVSAHTVFWQPGDKVPAKYKAIHRGEGWFLRSICSGALVASETIGGQLRAMAGDGGVPLPLILFLPLYERAHFEVFSPPDTGAELFRIFFAGRVEENKGVFDLVSVVERMRADGRRVRLDICGEGSAKAPLEALVRERGLEDAVVLHGHLERPAMLGILGAAHVVVVPTRSSFPEGFNQVVVEAVLARRPVVTSRICPALELVAPAAIEAEPDNPDSYRAAIESLIDDPALFAQKLAAGETLREQFFDPTNAWTCKAANLLSNTRAGS